MSFEELQGLAAQLTAVDVLVLAMVALLASVGFGQGFIVSALSLVGLVVGAVIGTRLAPALLDGGAESPHAPLFGLVGAIIAGGMLSGGLQNVGWFLRHRLFPRGSFVDRSLGGLLSAGLGIVLAWMFAAILLHNPLTRELRQPIQQSVILRQVNQLMPPSGPLLNALSRIDPLPAIRGPRIDVPPPNPAVAEDPRVRAAQQSIVRVIGTACGLGVSGTGWVISDDVVVTNAHVVAGTRDSQVQSAGRGHPLDADPVAFDARNDVAVLRVDGLDAPPLSFAPQAREGVTGAVMGYPENGPFTVRPIRVGSTSSVRTTDAYGNGPVLREIMAFRGNVRPGNSGGPLLDSRGRVLGTVFAATVGGRTPGGYAVPNEVVRQSFEARSEPASTGPCAR